MSMPNKEQITRFTRVFLAAAAALAIAQTAAAAYPEKSVRIVVAYPAGGAVDVVARKIAQKLTEQMGQTFYVENKPGAAGTIGTQDVARAKPDGYSLLAIDNSYTMLPYVFKKLPWDHDKAFVPITVSMFTPVLITVPANSKFKDLAGLLAYAKANPDKLNYGSYGNGSQPHLLFGTIQAKTGARIQQVPFRGIAPAITATLANDVQMTLGGAATTGAHTQAGKLKALAIGRKERLASFPNVPTLAEAGFGDADPRSWFGVFAPVGTPPAILSKISADIKKVLSEPEFRQRFIDGVGYTGIGSTPDEFAAFIKDDLAYKKNMIEKAGIQAE